MYNEYENVSNAENDPGSAEETAILAKHLAPDRDKLSEFSGQIMNVAASAPIGMSNEATEAVAGYKGRLWEIAQDINTFVGELKERAGECPF